MTDFGQVFQDNREFIYRYLCKLCRNKDLAEELTQETFFRAYMNLSGLRQPEKLPVWLCQIAKNTYFAWCRQQGKTVSAEEAGELPGGEEPEQTYLEKELSREAMAALNGLEEPYRQVLILAVFGELSLRSISETFGKSESWARVTFHRGKQKLLERMKKNDAL